MTTNPSAPSGGTRRQQRSRKVLFGSLAGIVIVGGGIYFTEQAPSNQTNVSAVSHQTVTSAAFVPTTTTASKSPSPSLIGTGYLAAGSTFVDFIQWNNSSGSLSGSEQNVTATGSPPNLSTENGTSRVSGVLRGSTISISLDGGAPVFGAATETSIVLNFPQPDGTLSPITFHKAGVTQFNNAVIQLNNTIQAANQSALEAAQQAALQAAQQAKAAKGQELSSIEATGNVIGTIDNSYSTPGASDMTELTFGQLPLAICYQVSGSSVGILSYEIGISSFHPLYDSSGATASSNTTGCVLDPGNDMGQDTFDVAMSGTGSFSVTVKQENPSGG